MALIRTKSVPGSKPSSANQGRLRCLVCNVQRSLALATTDFAKIQFRGGPIVTSD
jgi:hypothetical protein